MSHVNTIKLGNIVRDCITGYQGVALNKTEFMNGNTQFSVQPKAEDGKAYPDCISLDYHQLDVVEEGYADRTTEPTFKSPIMLGNKVRCIVTGKEGLATMKVTYMNGCSSFLILENDIDKQTGFRVTIEDWLDQTRLEVVDQGIVEQVKKSPANDKGNVPGGAPMRGIPRG